jgi:hypothetical protein
MKEKIEQLLQQESDLARAELMSEYDNDNVNGNGKKSKKKSKKKKKPKKNESKMRVDADAAAAAAAVAVVDDAQAGEQEETKEDSTAESLRICSYCESAHDSMRTLRQCSRCKTVRYCDRGCQRAHWKAHKAQCDRESTAIKERENRIQQAGFDKDEDKDQHKKSTLIVEKTPLRTSSNAPSRSI